MNEEIKAKESQLKQIKRSSKQLKNLKEPEPEFSFSLIKGQQTIMNKLAESNAQKEIMGVQRNWKIWGKGLRAMQKAIKKGVSVKMIGIIDPSTEKRAREWKEMGCKIKAYNKKFGEYPLRFTIIDGKEARITIGKPEIPKPKDYITIWTKSKPLINTLKAQFIEMWKQSKPL